MERGSSHNCSSSPAGALHRWKEVIPSLQSMKTGSSQNSSSSPAGALHRWKEALPCSNRWNEATVPEAEAPVLGKVVISFPFAGDECNTFAISYPSPTSHPPYLEFRVLLCTCRASPWCHGLSQHGRYDTAAAGHGTLIALNSSAKRHPCRVGRHSHHGGNRLGRAGPAWQHAGGHARQQAACTRLQAFGSGSAGAHHVQWALGGRVCGRDEQMEVRQILPLHPDTLCRPCVCRLRLVSESWRMLRTVHYIRQLLRCLHIAADWTAIIDEQGQRGAK